MEWIFDNWILLLLIGGMIGLHLFGHGGHGGHGGKKHKHPNPEKPNDTGHGDVADKIQTDDPEDKARTKHVDPAS